MGLPIRFAAPDSQRQGCGCVSSDLSAWPNSIAKPKSLVEVNGEPFLAHQLRLLKQQGIERVVLCTGYLGEMIEAWLGNGSRFGIKTSYSLDGPQLRGTAGALAGALPMLGDNFFALYGDSYVRCDFAAAQRTFLDSGKPGLMTIFRNEERWNSDCRGSGDSSRPQSARNRGPAESPSWWSNPRPRQGSPACLASPG
jgi:hypothetical protein